MKHKIIGKSNRKKRGGGSEPSREEIKAGIRTRVSDIPEIGSDGNPSKYIYRISHRSAETVPFSNTLLQIIIFLFVIGLCYYLIQNRRKIWGR